MPGELATQIVNVPDGELFDMSVNGQSLISEITARSTGGNNPTKWHDEAVEALRTANLRKTVTQKLGDLKKAAKIDVDPAYQAKSK